MSLIPMKQCINDYFIALQHLDGDEWLATFAADGASHDPAGAPPHVGHTALRLFFIAVTKNFASVSIAADEILIQGSRAAVTWRAKGVGANNRKVQFEGIDIFEMDASGKIKAVWGFWDPAAMFAELHG